MALINNKIFENFFGTHLKLCYPPKERLELVSELIKLGITNHLPKANLRRAQYLIFQQQEKNEVSRLDAMKAVFHRPGESDYHYLKMDNSYYWAGPDYWKRPHGE